MVLVQFLPSPRQGYLYYVTSIARPPVPPPTPRDHPALAACFDLPLISTLRTPLLAAASGSVLDSTYAWQGLQLTQLMGSDQFNFFGTAIARDGDTLAVVAQSEHTIYVYTRLARTLGPWYDTNGQRSGAVFLYRRGLGGPADWSAPLRITPDDTAQWDIFGSALALYGDTLVVGAPQSEYYTTDPGVAYVFEQTGPGLWAQMARLSASDSASYDQFGRGLALDGDTLTVTASGVGMINVFARDQGGPSSWGMRAQIHHSEHAFGSAIALSGDRLAVGAPHLTIGTAVDCAATSATTR